MSDPLNPIESEKPDNPFAAPEESHHVPQAAPAVQYPAQPVGVPQGAPSMPYPPAMGQPSVEAPGVGVPGVGAPGMGVPQYPGYSQQPGQNQGSAMLGIIALVFSILALLVAWVPFIGLLSIVFVLVAIICALVGLTQKKRGKAAGIIAIILSVVSLFVTFGVHFVIFSHATSAELSTIRIEKKESDRLEMEEEPEEDPDVVYERRRKFIDERLKSAQAIQPSKRIESRDAGIPARTTLEQACEYFVLASEEGSWKNPAAVGREAVGDSKAIAIESTDFDVTAEYVKKNEFAEVSNQQKVVKVTYKYTNTAGETSGLYFADLMLVSTTGSLYEPEYDTESMELSQSTRLHHGESISVSSYFIVNKDEELLALADIGGAKKESWEEFGSWSTTYFLALK